MRFNTTTMDGSSIDAEPDSSFRILTGCFLSLLILSTLLGNTLVCVAVIRFRHLRSKVTNFFVISLAVSDLLVAVLVMPWKAVSEITGFWPFGSFCSIWVAFDIMCSTASILNLCVISVDRYWAISSPFRYERKMTPKVAFVMISVAWTLSVLISFIPVQLDWHKAKPSTLLDYNISSQYPGDNCDSSLNRTYAISSSLISFYIPVAIMIVTYTRIYRIAQKQIRRISALERAAVHAKNCQSNRSSGSNADIQQPESSFKMSFKRETKVLKTLSVIMGVFVCCWLPFFILNCIVPFCESHVRSSNTAPLPCVRDSTFDVFVWFGWANSSLNPIIYAFNADFRKAFSTLLGCDTFCNSNAVEMVTIHNGVSSYNPGGSLDKVENCVYLIPHSVPCNQENPADPNRCAKLSPVSQHGAISLLSSNADYETDVSLEKIIPITQNGQHNT
ncbi:D(1) dopamine receptor-like [Heterodontus francisci]|uniref:D(1) dopamine receptor-like n=1 Tax=Heterodontus francisci TaxID=7792 RepID=UPI00355C5296